MKMNQSRTRSRILLSFGFLLSLATVGCNEKSDQKATSSAPAQTDTQMTQTQQQMQQQQATANPGNIVNPPTTPGKLEKVDLVVGDGPEAVAGKTVTVHYTGTLTNGKEFDSSRKPGREPFQFVLGAGQVIPGWEQGVAGMKVKGKRKLVIPPELGYGKQGAGNVIPPDSTLIFEVELLGVS